MDLACRLKLLLKLAFLIAFIVVAYYIVQELRELNGRLFALERSGVSVSTELGKITALLD